jgi:hypothetical protein
MVSKKYGGRRGAPQTKPPELQRKRQFRTNVARLKHPPQRSRQPKFFIPLRAADMDTDASGTEAISNEESVPRKTGRLPPIILTSFSNLIQLQKELQSVVKENFEFHNTRNGTRVITRGIADFQFVR